MRILITSILVVILAQPIFASSFQTQNLGIISQEMPENGQHAKGKGVIALLAGLTLGPVGYAATCIFSHNRIKRKKALLGMEIWTAVALSALLIILIAKGGGSSSSGSSRGSV